MDTVRRFAVLLSAVAILFAAARPALAWKEIHPGVANEASECVSWSPGRIDCFSRTMSGSLSWVYLENGKWSAPHDLGGKLAAAPSCVVRGPGGINCFATSAKGLLAAIYLNGDKWSKWASLGGELKASRAACVAHARDRIVCFARGRSDRLMTRKWSGAKTWEPWRDLGGALSADPECIVVGAAGAACFGRGAAGELVAFLPDASGKSGGWTTLGGRIEGRPSCLRLKSGEAMCAAQSVAGRLHLWRGMPVFAENAGATDSIDEVVTAEPTCALENATLICMTRNQRRQLVRRSFGAAIDTARDGVIAAPQAAALTCLTIGPDAIGCVLTGGERKLLFAAAGDLVAASLNAEVAADEPVEGLWYLSNRRTGSTCRVMLASDLAFGAKRLRAGPRCRRFLGLPARPAQWDRAETGLVFLAADGRLLIRFTSARAGGWISSQGETTGFLLTREAPGETGEETDDTGALSITPAAQAAMIRPTLTDIYGSWRVFAEAGVLQLCTIGLTDAPAGTGYAVQADPSCGERLAGVRYWTADGPALALVGADNITLARFDAAGPEEWRSQTPGGLTLKR